MFKPAKIFHVKTFYPKEKLDELIIKLHQKGVCQLKEPGTELAEEEKELSLKEIDSQEIKLDKLNNSLYDFRKIQQPENLIKQLLFPKPPEKLHVDLLSNEEIMREARETLEAVEPQVYSKTKRLDEISEKVDKNNYFIENLSFLPEASTNLFEPTEHLAAFLGFIAKDSLEKIKERLGEAVCSFTEVEDKNLLIGVFALKEKENEIDKLLHEQGFDELEVPFKKETPKKIIASLKNEIKQLQKEEKTLKEQLTGVWVEFNEKISALSEEVAIAKQRMEALNQFRKGKAFAAIEAWVPDKKFEEFKAILDEVSTEYFMEREERDDAPTILKNPRIIKPFELITNLYGPPKYRDFDPTPILFVSYALFFGFMLTDVVYGIFMALLGFVIFKGIGKYNPGMKQFASLIIVLGISTAALGAVFGSYFGDFFARIGIPLPGLLDPMKDIMLMVGGSIAIGGLHLLTGLGMGFLQNIKRKKFFTGLAKQGVWILTLIGAVIALVTGIGSIASFAGLGLIGIAVLIQLIAKFKEGGAIISVLSIFDFSGFLGDVFSYARLAALAVGTAGIALAVNFMALMVIEMVPVVGIVIAVLIFVVGHLFNMGMNGLGSFIHALRLHFLEFFTKFYDGDGKLYKPFYAFRKTNSTEVE